MNIRPYYKSVVAVIGSILSLGAFLASMQGFLPDNVSSTVAGILAVLTPVSVWLIKNEPLITDAADELADVVEITVGAFQKRGSE